MYFGYHAPAAWFHCRSLHMEYVCTYVVNRYIQEQAMKMNHQLIHTYVYISIWLSVWLCVCLYACRFVLGLGKNSWCCYYYDSCWHYCRGCCWCRCYCCYLARWNMLMLWLRQRTGLRVNTISNSTRDADVVVCPLLSLLLLLSLLSMLMALVIVVVVVVLRMMTLTTLLEFVFSTWLMESASWLCRVSNKNSRSEVWAMECANGMLMNYIRCTYVHTHVATLYQL